MFGQTSAIPTIVHDGSSKHLLHATSATFCVSEDWRNTSLLVPSPPGFLCRLTCAAPQGAKTLVRNPLSAKPLWTRTLQKVLVSKNTLGRYQHAAWILPFLMTPMTISRPFRQLQATMTHVDPEDWFTNQEIVICLVTLTYHDLCQLLFKSL